MAEQVYRITEAAELFGVSDDLLRDEIRDGRLTAKKIRRLTVVTERALDAWILALPSVPVAAPAPTAPTPKPPATAAVTSRRRGPPKRIVRRVLPIREV